MTLLRGQAGVAVVGEADSGRAAVAAVERMRSRVVIMDVRMPHASGIEACREIVAAWPETRVLMLTSFDDDSAAMASVMAGAAGYLLKHTTGRELMRAIETVAAGGSLLDPMLASKMLSSLRRGRPDELTEQERNVLELVGAGKTNREIAQTLFLAEKTVRNYVSNMLQKLGFESRSQAAAYAARRQALEG